MRPNLFMKHALRHEESQALRRQKLA
ncbi:hypothetical protein HNQ77_005173 [Silvibacterium bohemicum]|uniref:Uncharacterized protein n=1 Tax=Silvibacterium bohemicum TaxID=1577686 RepID=A0A841K5G4_9BACT|nr:hypothetical protein [Silvibacterium bohemicum]